MCVLVECTDIRPAAKESCTSSVSNVQSGKGQEWLQFQDGSFHCTNCYVNLYYLTFIITKLDKYNAVIVMARFLKSNMAAKVLASIRCGSKLNLGQVSNNPRWPPS